MPSLQTKKEIRPRLRLEGTRARDLILLSIYREGRNGLTQKELAKNTGLNRDTNLDETKKLEKERLVKIERKGKPVTRRVRYFATSEMFDEFALYSHIVGTDIFSKIDDHRILVRSMMGNEEYFPPQENSSYYDTSFIPKDANNIEETIIAKALFDYSVRLGAVITYLLIQVINPSTIRELIYNKKANSTMMIKDYFVQSWINNIIWPTRILESFRKLMVNVGYGIPSSEFERYPDRSSYELDEEAVKKVNAAFSKLYPSAYTELEKIRLELRNKLKIMKKEVEQTFCTHEYELTSKDRAKYFKCIRCDKPLTIYSYIGDNKTGGSLNNELADKLNKVKPPKNKNCLKFSHHWQNRSGYDVSSIVYSCALCSESVVVSTEDERRLRVIDKAVIKELGEINRGLCHDLEYFFHLNNNKEVTIDNFVKFYEKFRISIRIVDLEAFTETVLSIADILVKHGFVEEAIKSDIADKGPNTRIFIRRRLIYPHK